MGLPESMVVGRKRWCLVYVVVPLCTLGQQAKSREGLVDDPGTKAEKEAAAASYLRFRLAQNLAKRYPS